MLFLVSMTKYTVCACVAQQFLLYYKYLLLLQCLQSLILRRLDTRDQPPRKSFIRPRRPFNGNLLLIGRCSWSICFKTPHHHGNNVSGTNWRWTHRADSKQVGTQAEASKSAGKRQVKKWINGQTHTVGILRWILSQWSKSEGREDAD